MNVSMTPVVNPSEGMSVDMSMNVGKHEHKCECELACKHDRV